MTNLSKEVIEAAEPEISFDDIGFGLEVRTRGQVAERTIQAYLNSVWKPFDAKDEETWPEKFQNYYVIVIDEGPTDAKWLEQDDGCGLWDFYDMIEVTHYAGPADLLPNSIEERKE